MGRFTTDPTDPNSADLWRYADPDFHAEYPGVLAAVEATGFNAALMEPLSTQTLQDYRSTVANVGLPEDHDVPLEPGTAERIHWFDGVLRKAEESNFSWLSTTSGISCGPGSTRSFCCTGTRTG